MTDKLEDLEKQFIMNEDMEHEDIAILISHILKFCKVDNKGFVLVNDKKLKIANRVLLILSARYLGNKLQQKRGKEVTITESMTAKELAGMLKEKDTVIIARLKDLKDDSKVIPQDRGVYKVAPYAIADFLTELEGVKNERK